MGEVSVDDALAKGTFRIKGVFVAWIVGSLALLVALISPAKIIGPAVFLIPAIAFGCSFIYRSIAATKWKIWAFQNVRDVHELKLRAIRQRLINKDSSFWADWEIKTEADKQQLENLKSKFAKPDPKEIFVDDPTVPDRTEIFFSKGLIGFLSFSGVCLILLAAYALFQHSHLVIGFLLAIFGSAFVFAAFRMGSDHQPQLILDSQGIEVKGKGLKKWNEITKEGVITRGGGKSSSTLLIYDLAGSQADKDDEGGQFDDHDLEYDIDVLAVDSKHLEYLLHIYRGRFVPVQEPARHPGWAKD